MNKAEELKFLCLYFLQYLFHKYFCMFQIKAVGVGQRLVEIPQAQINLRGILFRPDDKYLPSTYEAWGSIPSRTISTTKNTK